MKASDVALRELQRTEREGEAAAEGKQQRRSELNIAQQTKGYLQVDEDSERTACPAPGAAPPHQVQRPCLPPLALSVTQASEDPGHKKPTLSH